MFTHQGGALLLATIPAVQLVRELRRELSLPDDCHDIHLAYSGFHGSELAGFLVTTKGRIDGVIAYCPLLSDLVVGSAMWRREVERQLQIAVRIATQAEMKSTRADAIWLRDLETECREMPTWLYSLACVPLTCEWDGKPRYPRPFCPSMFESMARQPQAPAWLMSRLHRLHHQVVPQ